MHALDAVAVQQGVGRLALQHPGKFPGQVAGVVQPGIQAAHAEDRHEVARVAREQHAAVAVAIQRQALGVVDRDPERLPGRGLADHVQVALHTRQHVFRLDGFVGVFVVADLVVDAPHVAGLAMHQQRGPRIGGRIEPRKALDGPLRFLFDVDDDVAPLVLYAFQLQAHRVAHGAAAAVAGDEPIGAHRLAGAVRLHLDRYAVRTGLHGRDACRPGKRGEAGMAPHGLVREFLHVVLLDVHHRGVPLQGIVRHLEVQDFAVAVVASPARPGQTRVDQRPVGADPAQDLLRPARHADGAAAAAIAFIGLNGEGGDAVLGEQGGQGQPDRTAAGDQDGNVRGERHAVSRIWLFAQLYARHVARATNF